MNGAAILNSDNRGDPAINLKDRTYALGSGITSNTVPVFFPEKVVPLIGIGGEAESVGPDISLPSGRTSRFQQ